MFLAEARSWMRLNMLCGRIRAFCLQLTCWLCADNKTRKLIINWATSKTMHFELKFWIYLNCNHYPQGYLHSQGINSVGTCALKPLYGPHFVPAGETVWMTNITLLESGSVIRLHMFRLRRLKSTFFGRFAYCKLIFSTYEWKRPNDMIKKSDWLVIIRLPTTDHQWWKNHTKKVRYADIPMSRQRHGKVRW